MMILSDFLLWAAIACACFLPAAIARHRNHRHKLQVFLANVFVLAVLLVSPHLTWYAYFSVLAWACAGGRAPTPKSPSEPSAPNEAQAECAAGAENIKHSATDMDADAKDQARAQALFRPLLCVFCFIVLAMLAWPFVKGVGSHTTTDSPSNAPILEAALHNAKVVRGVTKQSASFRLTSSAIRRGRDGKAVNCIEFRFIDERGQMTDGKAVSVSGVIHVRDINIDATTFTEIWTKNCSGPLYPTTHDYAGDLARADGTLVGG